MHCKFHLVCLLNGLFVISHAQMENPGICSNKGSPAIQCCPNYKRRDDSCEECWPGTFGVDCKDECPDGYYGRFCVQVCGCSSCDKFFGCQTNSSQTDTTNQDKSYIENSIIASSLAGSVTFVILIVIYCKRRNRTSRTPTSLIYKGGEQASSTVLNGVPHLSSSSSHATHGGDADTTFRGGECKPLNVQMCCQQNKFADKSINPNENSRDMLSTSDSVYNHLNMDVDNFNRLDRTLNSSQKIDDDLYCAHTSNRSCNNTTESRCSSRNNEKGLLLLGKDRSEDVNNYSEIADIFETHDTSESENDTIDMIKKVGILPVNPGYVEELSRKLHSCQLKPKDIEFNDSV